MKKNKIDYIKIEDLPEIEKTKILKLPKNPNNVYLFEVNVEDMPKAVVPRVLEQISNICETKGLNIVCIPVCGNTGRIKVSKIKKVRK